MADDDETDIPDYDAGFGPWPAEVEVHEQDNPVVARLVGVDGAVLVEVRERRVVPFGFRR